MIIFLYGRDSYRLKQNLEKIVEGYRAKNPSGVSFYTLDLEESGQLTRLEDIIKTVSFFNEKKLVVLKNSFGLGDSIGKLIKKWDLAADKGMIFVFAESQNQADLAKKDKKHFALLSAKPNLVKSFEPLAGKKLADWIESEAEGLQAPITREAIQKLILFTGSDSWRIREELVKLANYLAGSNRKTIGQEEVELLVVAPLTANIFDTVDAIGGRQRLKAAALLERHLERGDDPYYLFSMVVYQFRNLLKVKSLAQKYMSVGDIAKKAGLHPFVARKTFDQAKKFELAELKQKFSALAESDIAIKTGAVDVVDCLYQIALS